MIAKKPRINYSTFLDSAREKYVIFNLILHKISDLLRALKLFRKTENIIKLKIILNFSNYDEFFNKIEREKKKTNKYFDGYIGFFGYEILCHLIGVKIPKQKINNFSKGIFYKPKTIIKIRNKTQIENLIKHYVCLKSVQQKNKKNYHQKKFAVNLSLKRYTLIFNKFLKKIKQGETDPIEFFWKLMEVNCSPESFIIRDKDYSIISCSPETLIEKKNNILKTKPIAGTMQRTKYSTRLQAKKFFQQNKKERKNTT